MSTTITPAIGNGALFTQQGVGTSPGYSAIDDRRAATLALQEGVYGASDFMVVQRGIGANLSVDIGMPAGGFALVQGDSVAGQALYTVPVHSSTVNEAIATADPTNPRVDQVILEVLDNVHDASGSNLARTRVLTGTATAGATLTNRTGAAALPSSALLLADVLVGATVTSVDNTKIRDRRKFARGAYVRVAHTTGGQTASSGGSSALIAPDLTPRIECSGAPMRMTLQGRLSLDAAGSAVLTPWLDGVGVGSVSDPLMGQVAGASDVGPLNAQWSFVPSGGSHTIGWAWRASGANATLQGSTSQPIVVTIEEIPRQNTANNSVTSG